MGIHKKKFYQSVCSFAKEARKFNGEFAFYDTNLNVTICLKGNKMKKLEVGEFFEINKALGIACVNAVNGCFECHTMALTLFIRTGQREGGSIKF